MTCKYSQHNIPECKMYEHASQIQIILAQSTS